MAQEPRSFQKVQLNEKYYSERNEKFAVSLRKNKRFEKVNARRIINHGTYYNLEDILLKAQSMFPDLMIDRRDVINVVKALLHDLGSMRDREIMKILRRLSSVSEIVREVSIEIYNQNRVEQIISYTSSTHPPDVQSNAMWIIANLTTQSEPWKQLISAGIIQIAIGLTCFGYDKLSMNCLWALANIAHEGQKIRDQILEGGVLDKIEELRNKGNISNEMTEIMMYLCSSLTSNNVKHPIKFEYTKAIMDIIKEEFALNRPIDITKAMLKTMLQITDGDNDCISATLGEGSILLSQVVRALLTPATVSPHLHHDMLLWVSGVATGSDWHTSSLLTLNVLDALQNFIDHQDCTVRHTVYFTLSNIAGGTSMHAVALMKHSIFQKLLEMLLRDNQQYKNRLEISQVFYTLSLTLKENSDFLRLLDMPFLQNLAGVLDTDNSPQFLHTMLPCLYELLKVGHEDMIATSLSFNRVWHAIEDTGILDHIEKYQMHQNTEVSDTATKMILDFIGTDDENNQQQDKREINLDFWKMEQKVQKNQMGDISDAEEGELIEDETADTTQNHIDVDLPQKRKPELPLVSSSLHKGKPYKKLPCKYFAVGTCHRGEDCTYIHETSTKTDLWKHFLKNACIKGAEWNFSHDTRRFPCKYLFSVGYWQSGNECRFSHVKIKPDRIMSFIQQNEDFLIEVLKQQGMTMLGDQLLNYLRDRNKLPQPVIVPFVPVQAPKIVQQNKGPNLSDQLESCGILKNTSKTKEKKNEESST